MLFKQLLADTASSLAVARSGKRYNASLLLAAIWLRTAQSCHTSPSDSPPPHPPPSPAAPSMPYPSPSHDDEMICVDDVFSHSGHHLRKATVSIRNHHNRASAVFIEKGCESRPNLCSTRKGAAVRRTLQNCPRDGPKSSKRFPRDRLGVIM